MIAIPCVYMGGAALCILMRERRANADLVSLRLPRLQPPGAHTRLLVFSPHPDDDTLGCAGLMQQTLAQGGTVEVVFLTNGDAFRTAVECMTHRMNVTPADYLRFADLRQQESLRALQHLGVPAQNILFLGYPDRGSMEIWNRHWNASSPYTSPFTASSHVPYPRAWRQGAPYCGTALLGQIEQVMRQYRPTLVTVTHPQDAHVDHEGASVFVTCALQLLRLSPADSEWAQKVRLRYFLVHRGDWPEPQGVYPSLPLLPPRPMAFLDTTWKCLPLTHAEILKKLQSIDLYKSQTAMMGRFLRSFARRTEIYGELPRQMLLPGSSKNLPVTPRSAAWKNIAPTLLNPLRDDVLRAMNGSANIRALYACRSKNTLAVQVMLRDPAAVRYLYHITLRPINAAGQSGSRDLQVVVSPRTKKIKNGIIIRVRGRRILFLIPWRLLQTLSPHGIDLLSLSARTTLATVPIDKTGPRILLCKPFPSGQQKLPPGI